MRARVRVRVQVLPRCFLQACLGGLAGGLMEWYQWELTVYGDVWRHPYALHVFGMVLGFTLVMRIQIAYARFYEGATTLRTMTTKLGDAAMQIMTFDETPLVKPPEPGELTPHVMPAVMDEDALEFRMQIIHYFSLCIPADEASSPGLAAQLRRVDMLVRAPH